MKVSSLTNWTGTHGLGLLNDCTRIGNILPPGIRVLEISLQIKKLQQPRALQASGTMDSYQYP
jgi:hypothetical protein